MEFSTTANIRDKSRSSSSFLSYKSSASPASILMSNSITANVRLSVRGRGDGDRVHGYTRIFAGFTLHPHNVYARIYPRTVSRGCASFDDKCCRISRFHTLDASSVSSPSARQYVTRDIYRRGIFASGLRACEKEKYADDEKSE